MPALRQAGAMVQPRENRGTDAAYVGRARRRMPAELSISISEGLMARLAREGHVTFARRVGRRCGRAPGRRRGGRLSHRFSPGCETQRPGCWWSIGTWKHGSILSEPSTSYPDQRPDQPPRERLSLCVWSGPKAPWTIWPRSSSSTHFRTWWSIGFMPRQLQFCASTMGAG